MKKLSYEKWVASLVQTLAEYFNLQGWNIKVEFSNKPKSDCEGAYACMNSNSVYMQATLTVYPMGRESWDEDDLDRLVEVLTHELSHLLIDPLHEHAVPFLSETTRPLFTNILENVTQRTALVILKGLPKNIIPPR